jgi:hypothetical protein
MGAIKRMPKKLRLIAVSKKKAAPRWADLKKFNKRARSRKIKGPVKKHWRKGRLQK